MEISLEVSCSLNEANYYERRGERALLNISRFIGHVENNYVDAVDSFQRALGYLDKAKSELGINGEEMHIIEMRQESLHRQFDSLQPYRFLLTHRSINGSNATRSQSVESRTSPDTFVFLADDSDHNLHTSKFASSLKLYPRRSDQRLEECEVRINELEKMVNELSLKLEESERRVALEENARLMAEGELLMLRRPHRWNSTSSPTDSLHNSNSMETSRHSHSPEHFGCDLGNIT